MYVCVGNNNSMFIIATVNNIVYNYSTYIIQMQYIMQTS